MTLQSSGAISFADLQTEFGGSNPIGINEYYKDGAYVPSTITADATASNLSIVGSYATRSGYTTAPRIMDGSNLYYHNMWTDAEAANGATNFDAYIDLDLAGTYTVTQSGYSTGVTKTCGVYVDDVLQFTLSSSSGTVSNTFVLTGPATVRLDCYMAVIGNFNQQVIKVNGANNGVYEVTATFNPDIPTSGVLSMNDFYSGQGN